VSVLAASSLDFVIERVYFDDSSVHASSLLLQNVATPPLPLLLRIELSESIWLVVMLPVLRPWLLFWTYGSSRQGMPSPRMAIDRIWSSCSILEFNLMFSTVWMASSFRRRLPSTVFVTSLGSTRRSLRTAETSSLASSSARFWLIHNAVVVLPVALKDLTWTKP